MSDIWLELLREGYLCMFLHPTDMELTFRHCAAMSNGIADHTAPVYVDI